MISKEKTAQIPVEGLDFRAMFDAYPDAVFVIATDGHILLANLSAVERYGYTREEFTSMNVADLAPPELRNAAGSHVKAALESGERFEWRHLRKDGSEVPVEIFARSADFHGVKAIVASVRELTEQKRAYQEKLESEQRYRLLFENMNSGFVLFEVAQNEQGAPVDLIILDANAKFAQTTGLVNPNVIGKRLTNVLPGIEKDPADWIGTFGEIALRGNAKQFEQNSELLGSYYSIVAYQPEPMQCAVNFIDITESKLAEEALRLSEQRFRLVTEQGGVAVWEYDFTTNSMARSDNHDLLYGLERQEKCDIDTFLQATHPDDREISNQVIQSAVAPGGDDDYHFEFRVVYPDKSVHWLMVSGQVVQRNARGEGTIVQGCLVDITRIKSTEIERDRLSLIAESSSEFIGMCDLELTPIYVNPAGRHMVGLTDLASACRIKVQDYFFPEDRRRIAEEFFPQVLRDGKGELEVRLRHFQTGEPIWVHYYLFSVLDHTGKPVGWATVSHDISERKRMLRQKETAARKLKNALLDTIQSIASILDKRDPYTSGHQVRVAQLAKAIGIELGLSGDILEGLWLGSSIHDIGKISIPSELLSKPGQLSDAEFQLIKEHSQVGYDILKDVDFPWPIADMILQHHERLDASGYPHGLSGDAIIMEARILAVADVFEAMSSYRPYRPALGVETALEFIRSGRGTLFDARVVDACNNLVINKAFVFDKAKQ